MQFKQVIYKSSFHENTDRIHLEDDLALHLGNEVLDDLHHRGGVLQDELRLFAINPNSDDIHVHDQTNIQNKALLKHYDVSESSWVAQVREETLEAPERHTYEQYIK
jgi:hypothetical protein